MRLQTCFQPRIRDAANNCAFASGTFAGSGLRFQPSDTCARRSARMARLAAKGKLKIGDDFVHASIIGSLFDGRVEAAARVGNHDAIVPSISGWARQHGINTILVDDRDPFAHGFQVV